VVLHLAPNLKKPNIIVFVFVKDWLVDLFSLFFALVERVMICTDNNNAEVDCEVSNIDVKNELLWNTWDTYWSPSFSSIFHTWICIDIVHKHLNVLRF